jgi:hypothetical protein
MRDISASLTIPRPVCGRQAPTGATAALSQKRSFSRRTEGTMGCAVDINLCSAASHIGL